ALASRFINSPASFAKWLRVNQFRHEARWLDMGKPRGGNSDPKETIIYFHPETNRLVPSGAHRDWVHGLVKPFQMVPHPTDQIVFIDTHKRILLQIKVAQASVSNGKLRVTVSAHWDYQDYRPPNKENDHWPTALAVAAREGHEETGIHLDPARLFPAS